MIRMILRLDGLGPRPNREELKEYAKNLAVVRIIVDQRQILLNHQTAIGVKFPKICVCHLP